MGLYGLMSKGGLLLLVLVVLLIACAGDQQTTHLDGDTSDSEENDGGPNPNDGDIDTEADPSVLMRFESRVPDERNLVLVLKTNGAFIIDYNYSGEDAFSEHKEGRIDAERVNELSGYIVNRLAVLTGLYELDGVDCLVGKLSYQGASTSYLRWRCSEDPDLLAFLDYLHQWMDNYITGFGNTDGDLIGDGDQTPDGDQVDGDLDLDGDLDFEGEWEGSCKGPGDYVRIPLLDYRYKVPGDYEVLFVTYSTYEYRIDYTPADGPRETYIGMLTPGQTAGLVSYLRPRMSLLDCFDGQWCERARRGHIYLFEESSGDGDDDSDDQIQGLFIDFYCPQAQRLLESISHLNATINGLGQVSIDGDTDDEDADGDEETIPDGDIEAETALCDDFNTCTNDSWDDVDKKCLHERLDDHVFCDDGIEGTESDECLSGQCLGTNPNCPDWPLNERGFCETNILGNGRWINEMIFLPQKSFQQGFTRDDCDLAACDDAKPYHTTVLTQGAWVDKFESTEEAYYKFVQDEEYHAVQPVSYDWSIASGNPCSTSYGPFDTAPAVGHDNYPVTEICWNAAVAFCRWTGKRMPSEAEWEYAARGPNGNPAGRLYPWGDADPLCRISNFGDSNGDGANTDPCWNQVIDVGSYNGTGQTFDGSSYFGIHDLAGNASEWVFDAFSTYSSGSFTNPVSISGGVRTIRGGSYSDAALRLKSAFRHGASQIVTYNTVGFRCASPKNDSDRDGISDQGGQYCLANDVFYCSDNCPTVPNPYQENDDGGFPGDACEDRGAQRAPADGDTDDDGMETENGPQLFAGWEAEDIAGERYNQPWGGLETLVAPQASGGAMLKNNSYIPGDQIVLAFDLDQDFEGELRVSFYSQDSSAKVRLFMDTPLGYAMSEVSNGREPINLYSGALSARLPTSFPVSLTPGTHLLVIKVIDKDEHSYGYDVTLDRIELWK